MVQYNPTCKTSADMQISVFLIFEDNFCYLYRSGEKLFFHIGVWVPKNGLIGSSSEN